MHIFFVGEEIPYDGLSGSNTTGLCIVRYLLDVGHQITAFVNPPNCEPEERQEEMLRSLADIGVHVVSLNDVRSSSQDRSRWKRVMSPRLEDFFPTVRYSKEIRVIIEEHIDRLRPDMIFAFGVAAIGCTFDIDRVPKFAPICENIFKILRARYLFGLGKAHSKAKVWALLFSAWRVFRKSVQLHAHMQGRGQFCYDWQEDSKRLGLSDCKMYNMPVIDQVGSRWRSLRDSAHSGKSSQKAKIVMVGASSTFTLMHLHSIKSIMPSLIERLNGSFELHLCGSIALPPDLEDLLDYEPVQLRGYVDDIEAEFLSCDVLLVPTPIKVAARSRIIMGLSYGCCLVTTIHEQESTPGLRHRHNALIAMEEAELVGLIEQALSNEQLRREIETNARQTYEDLFRPEVSVGEMERDMSRIVEDFRHTHRLVESV